MGGAHFVFAAIVLVRWLTSGTVQRTPTGPDTAPGYVLFAVHFFDIFSPLLSGYLIYRFLIRPWRRERQLTADGLLIVAWLLMYFPYDPVLNYTQYWFQWNSYHWNQFGSWTSSLPGVITPRAHFHPEPILTWGVSYTWSAFLPMVGGSWVMRKLKERRPGITRVQLVLVMIGAFAIFDLAMEPLFMRLQLWSYAGSIHGLSLWAGTKYQFPLYEPLMIGIWYALGSSLRYFKDDKGRMVVERGIDDLEAGPAARNGLRLLATIGATAALFNLTYNLPSQFVAAHAGSFPKDLPSYLRNQVCGQGTPVPCPGPRVPIFKPGSVSP